MSRGDTGEAPVRLSVLDPVGGDDVASADDPNASLDVAPKLCEQGVEITVESTVPPGEAVTAMVWRYAGAEDPDRCDVSLEAP